MIEEDYYEEDYASDYDWREEEWDACKYLSFSISYTYNS